MDLQEFIIQIIQINQLNYSIIALGVLGAGIAYFTKGGRNFRSSRNRRARKQF